MNFYDKRHLFSHGHEDEHYTRGAHAVIAEWQGKSRYGDLKQQVAASVSQLLTDFQARLAEISDEDVLSLLPAGEAYANQLAEQKLKTVYEKVGLA